MRAPRPNDPKLLKKWAAGNWPGDATRQGREVQAGLKAIDAAKVAADRHNAEMARRQMGQRKGRGR